MDSSLTRRGWGLVALLVACVAIAGWYGAGSLNAVVAPGVAALAAAFVVVRRAEPPSIERRLPGDGFPGDVGTVSLDVEAGRAGVYELRDGVPAGLAAEGGEPAAAVADASATVEYEVGYERRGAHEFGPVEVAVADVLGLVRRDLSASAGRDRLLVFPEVAAPPEPVRSAVAGLLGREQRPGRDEFDRLREYDRGDALRDVHWKTSAKRPEDDLVVKQFRDATPDRAVRIAAGARGSRTTVDAAARATASVACHLLDAGVDVGISTPDARIEPGQGPEHRRAALAALAELRSGDAPDLGDAQVRISAAKERATVTVAGRSVAFEGEGEERSGADENERRSADVDGVRSPNGRSEQVGKSAHESGVSR